MTAKHNDNSPVCTILSHNRIECNTVYWHRSLFKIHKSVAKTVLFLDHGSQCRYNEQHVSDDSQHAVLIKDIGAQKALGSAFISLK